jgi:beta-xylosidase
MLCVGVAHSKTVTGPFEDIGIPLVRNSSVGNIDPTFFDDVATGKKYVIWKEDGNGATPPEKYTPIWAAEVSADALKIIGDKIKLLENDPNSWEGPLVEAPWVVKHNGTYYLFYSGNGYASSAVRIML